MDARIGKLNSGKFYAFADGHDKPEFVGTLEEVEARLSGGEAPRKTKSTVLRRYIVSAKLKFPSCFNSGYEFEIRATTKALAIQSARRKAQDEGHTRQDGALIYYAQEI